MTPSPAVTLRVQGAQAAGPHLTGLHQVRNGEQPRTADLFVEAYLEDGETAVAVRHEACPLQDPDWGAVRPCASSIGLVSGGRYRAFAQAGRDATGQFRGQLRQITDLREGQGAVVWVETPSTDLSGNEWVIRSWQQTTGRVSEVAHSRHLRDGHRYAGYPGSTVPVVLNGRAYWPSPVPTSDHPGDDDPHDWTFRVLSAPLSGGGAVRTIATDAAFAAVTDGDLFYATHVTNKGKHTAYVIHQRSGGNGSDRVLARGAIAGRGDLTNLDAGAGMVAWTVGSPDDEQGWEPGVSTPGRLYLMELATSRVTEIVTDDDVGGHYWTGFGPGRFLWGNGSGNGDAGQYLLEPSTGALFRLGAAPGGSVVVSAPTGDLIRWSDPCSSTAQPRRTCDAVARWAP